MSRIQSSTGLITGIPIEDTVNKLMAVASQPRDLLAARTKTLTNEKLAVNNLSSLVLALQFESNRLASPNLFQTKTVTSSAPDTVAAKLADNANPPAGTYQLRSLQTASAQQLASSRFQSVEDLATAGTLTFGFGGFVDKGISLEQLNGGAGVRRGVIRITDRAGNAADVDLRIARTVDDVLTAINNNATAHVQAVVDGDTFRLVDTSGGSGSLKVQELSGGKTALDLGLAGINVAANEATGLDVFRLVTSTKLSTINDGNGVPLAAGNDLAITLADNTALSVDLGEATTLGDVIAAINLVSPTKLTATIAADGNRIQLNDLTTGGGTFAVANVGSGTAASALGLTADATGATLTGGRLVSGLRDTLVSSLHGGQGVGTLGQISITNRNTIVSSVDLSGLETLNEVVGAINDQATGVTAAINSAHNGITLTDTTGAALSNLIIADGDANNSATALGLIANTTATSVSSGTLDRQQLGRATLLSSLNGGKGIDVGDLLLTDSNGVKGAVDLNTPGNEAKTLGDVIDRINALSTADVEARINDTGDGILIADHAGGTGKFSVTDVGNHTTGASLRLTGDSVIRDIGGTPTQVIDGTSRQTVDLSDLTDEGTGVQLSSLNSGNGVSLGSFRITDRSGQTAVVVLNSTAGTFETVGDVIDAINDKSIGVEARVNDEGTGILLFDTSGGNGTLKVEDLAGGKTAADLGLDGEGIATEVDGESTLAIDGAGTFSQSATQTGLSALADKVNSLDAGVTASTVFDGVGYRLLLQVNQSGAGNELLVDGFDAGLSFDQLSAARDAVVEFGGSEVGSGVLITSTDNKFNNLISGVELTLTSASTQTVTVNVAKSQSGITDTVQDFIDGFNSVRDNIDKTTSFDPENLTTGILFGTTTALRVESDLNRLLSGRFFGVGRFTTLESIGLSFDDKGKLSLNSTKFEKALNDDPDALEKFFTDKTLGVSAKLNSAIDQLAGDKDSVLSSRSKSLADVIDNNNNRVSDLDDQLSRQRDTLLNTFAQLETTVSQLQRGLSALSSFKPIAPLGS